MALAIGPLVGGALVDARLAADLLDQPADRRRLAIIAAPRRSRPIPAPAGVSTVAGLLALAPA